MQFAELISGALTVLRANRIRTALTLLSIGIGVFSIMSVMTGLGALQSSIASGLSSLGANTFQIQKYPNNFEVGGHDRSRFRNRPNLTYDQAVRLTEVPTGAEHIGIESWSFGYDVKYGNTATDPNVAVAGETPSGFPTNHWIVENGRAVSESDVALSRMVAVLGADLASSLFPPNIDPVGKTVRLNGMRYTVIGVLESRGGLFGNKDRYFIIPISTFFAEFGRNRSVNIMVQAPNKESFEAVQEKVIGALRGIRGLAPDEENNFEFFSNDSVIQQFNDLTYYIRVGTLAVAAIALLAAGIGIMNIMLVSVSERTREIGTRKAVGAKKRDIVRQFLSEAVLLAAAGGTLGIFAGLLAGNGLAWALGIGLVIDPWWVLIGLVSCTTIGISFGTYPAWKAAQLDPIEALRYE